jgi:hypothetical protein
MRSFKNGSASITMTSELTSVLFVDDDPDIVNLFKATAEESGEFIVTGI